MEKWREHRNIKIATTESLLSMRTKLSCYKIFHRKFISNRNKKNSNSNE